MTIVVKRRAKPVDADPLLTTEDVADQLSVSARQVTRWMNERRIEFVRLPQGRRIRQSALDEWVNEHTEPAA